MRPAKTQDAAAAIYQLKITLLGTDTPIWRRVLVPAGLTLANVHTVLQVAMGWDNAHLHEFRAGKQVYGVPNPEEKFFGPSETINERHVQLSQVLGRVGAKLVYTYDFGDSWEHSVVLEKRLPADPNVSYPVCLGGERACPPEDCGGIPGFYNLLEAIQYPQHEEHEQMLEWVGEYDPDAFSVEKINRVLQRTRRRAR